MRTNPGNGFQVEFVRKDEVTAEARCSGARFRFLLLLANPQLHRFERNRGRLICASHQQVHKQFGPQDQFKFFIDFDDGRRFIIVLAPWVAVWKG